VRNNDGEPWYNNNMKESDLPDLPDEGNYKYVLSTTCPGGFKIEEYLLTTGEIVRGINNYSKEGVVNWVKRDGDIYLGIGVKHD
jgi:hypothetical protein